MRNVLKVSLLLALGLFSTSCWNKRSEKAQTAVKNVVKEYKIMGIWESDCHNAGLEILGSSVGFSEKSFFKFAGSDFLQAEEVYATADCTQPTARVQYEGTFSLDDKNDLGENARTIDLDYTKIVVEPLTDNGAKALNTAGFCGISNWKAGESQDVSRASAGALCKKLGQTVPKKVYDVIKIEDNTLYFGTGGSAETPDKRPKELNKDDGYTESKRKFKSH